MDGRVFSTINGIYIVVWTDIEISTNWGSHLAGCEFSKDRTLPSKNSDLRVSSSDIFLSFELSSRVLSSNFPSAIFVIKTLL